MKKIFVTKSTLPPMEEYVELLKGIWSSAWLTNMGQYHNELEALLSRCFESENVSLFANGHLALEMLLEAFELKGEVITTPFSFAFAINEAASSTLSSSRSEEPVFFP